MEKLPSEITLDIFYRIPAETLVQCKFVCKSWHNIIIYGDGGANGDANYFANMHLHRHNQLGNNLKHSTLTFIAMQDPRRRDVEKLFELHITEFDGDDDQLSCTRINFPADYNCIGNGWKMGNRSLAGSCNGLICLPRRYGITYLEDAIAICNPLLKEYVTLPLSDRHFQSGSMARRDIRLGHIPIRVQYKVIIGFGFHPGTGKYKVVRVDYGHYSNPDIGDVEVYTLGDKSINGGMWRSRGTINYKLVGHCRAPVLLNGSLHWLALKRILHGREERVYKQIFSFDLKGEEFNMIPIPYFPPFAGIGFLAPSTQLLELGRGCLCLIRTGPHEMDIWVLTDYMNKESWVKEFRMEWEGTSWCYSPCAIKKKNSTDDDDHEILLWCDGKSGLVSYDTKTQNFEDVGGGVEVSGARPPRVCVNSQDPVHHISSLVSLKALGEDSSKNKGRWTRKRKRIVEGSWTRRHKLIRNIIVKAKASAYGKKKRKKRKTCKALVTILFDKLSKPAQSR